MEICEHFQQFFIGFVDSSDQVAHLIFFKIFGKSLETMFHKLVDLDGIMIFVATMNGEAEGANESTIFAVGIDAYESGVLLMGMAVVGFDELMERLFK